MAKDKTALAAASDASFLLGTGKKISGNADAAILLSDNAAAAWLGISRATFWRRVSDGTFPRPVRIGGATRWRRDEILDVVEAASRARVAAA